MPVPTTLPEYRNLSDWVVLKILDAIREGLIQPGERLTERDVAGKFNASRAPVRDAIRELEKLGVVARRPSRAICVRNWTRRDAAEVLVILDALIVVSVQLCIDCLRPDDIAELEEIVNQTRLAVTAKSNNVEEQLELDFRFHRVIMRASGNRRLVELFENLNLPLQLYQQDFLASVGRVYSLRTHGELLEALKRRDLDEAVECTMRHVQESQTAVIKILQEPAAVAGDALRVL